MSKNLVYESEKFPMGEGQGNKPLKHMLTTKLLVWIRL